MGNEASSGKKAQNKPWRCAWCDCPREDAGSIGIGPMHPRTGRGPSLCSLCLSKSLAGHTEPAGKADLKRNAGRTESATELLPGTTDDGEASSSVDASSPTNTLTKRGFRNKVEAISIGKPAPTDPTPKVFRVFNKQSHLAAKQVASGQVQWDPKNTTLGKTRVEASSAGSEAISPSSVAPEQSDGLSFGDINRSILDLWNDTYSQASAQQGLDVQPQDASSQDNSYAAHGVGEGPYSPARASQSSASPTSATDHVSPTQGRQLALHVHVPSTSSEVHALRKKLSPAAPSPKASRSKSMFDLRETSQMLSPTRHVDVVLFDMRRPRSSSALRFHD